MTGRTVKAQFPPKLKALFKPSRYKVFYGGRGGAKSWGFARALLIMGASKPIRVLCCREIQKSIEASVYTLLVEQIKELCLDGIYSATQQSIKGPNGTEFFFEGLWRNATNLKSYEGVDICWVEEAQVVSPSSWNSLIPTIRKDGSEIWISFNPDLATDETYQRFIINTPPGAELVEINWRDNPWFPEVLRVEKDHLSRTNPDLYLNIWEGKPKEILEGAIFTEELRAVSAEGRICKVPYDPSKPVDTYWDLGYADFTSIWFVQAVGLELHIIDFFQDHLKGIPYYCKELQRKEYNYRLCCLPHDAKAGQLAAEGRTIEQQVIAAGFKTKVIPRCTHKIQAINAARAIFPLCVFDEKNTADGLQALRHYCYKFNQDTGQYSKDPDHNHASHAADAFEQLGLAIKAPKIVEPRQGILRPQQSVSRWAM